MRNASSYFIILVISLLVTACGGRSAVDNVAVGSIGGLAGSSLLGDGLSDGSSLSSSPLFGLSQAELISHRVVYYDYDSSNLTADSRIILQAHATHLSSTAGVSVILEGHADERGTREYNLALGEDRAKSASDLMQVLGLDSARIQTISYGEERPASLDTNETAWGLNRRVEILYK